MNFQIGEFDKAVELTQRVLHERPKQQGAKLIQAAAYAHSNRSDKAGEALGDYMEQAGAFDEQRVFQVFSFSDPEEYKHLMDGLRIAGLPD